MAVGEGTSRQFAWDQGHNCRVFDTVMGQCVESLPAVDDFGGRVLVGQNDSATAQLAPFYRNEKGKMAT